MEGKQQVLLSHWEALLGAAEAGMRAAQDAHAAERKAAEEAAIAAAQAAQGTKSQPYLRCNVSNASFSPSQL